MLHNIFGLYMFYDLYYLSISLESIKDKKKSTEEKSL